ncbi:uncharacterized protein LOC121957579 [Plectropomus leopardus]|uniref:uncharacterized protein LOC121957579 n=1 Tax=Plectropomus leopardus TaxID=160734 RepID=UPI001C4B6C51|nr:uncharacterized protein LOC121957579 [Plectropomus leopardus]
MNLWLSSCLLVALLFLSSSALTPEECRPVLAPLSLDEPSVIHGRWNFLLGYTDYPVFSEILQLTESSWINVASSSGAKDMVMSQENRINGSCTASTSSLTIDGNTLTASVANFTSVFHLLPTCDSCLVMSINTSGKAFDKFLEKLKFHSDNTEDVVHARSLYLMSRESTLKDSDLEHFKQQASCLGFTGELNFHYDPKNDFCAEGEGVKLFP